MARLPYADSSNPEIATVVERIERERGKVIELLQGELPSPIDPPSGCVFRTRCPQAIGRCAQEVPALRAITGDSEAACILA